MLLTYSKIIRTFTAWSCDYYNYSEMFLPLSHWTSDIVAKDVMNLFVTLFEYSCVAGPAFLLQCARITSLISGRH